MPFTVTVTANTPEVLRQDLLAMADALAPSTLAAPVLGALPPHIVIEPKGKGGRKKQADEPKQTDIEDVAPSKEGNSASAQGCKTPPAEEAATYDDAVSSLQKLNGKHGMQAVRVLLGEFGYQKVGDMKPDKYAAIIKKADEQTAA